ncbi:MAG: bkdB [Hydrocarboniphaga sp.]|uniref:dihydrolipoamide acetyltransferase family protein n=1 Tax=Hydrocarboniphaga sp. TaxID=2033016 RepID=UPI00261D201F|nr:dihydrolipoamide acetyltransferase family protein [Hydrocarboniphaga sp.]MDB5971269.1 bkdB [Hydrocarboniphaga sp.]
MSRYVFKLPDVGEGIAESEIATWRVKLGERVVEDQPLVDMLTDKAAVEIPSPVSGVIVALYGEAGDKVAVGGALLEIETAADDAGAATAEASVVAKPAVEAPAAKAAPLAAAPAPVSVSVSVRPAGEKPQTSPAVRKRARELDIDLNLVPGTGPRGRITLDDVSGHAPASAKPASADDDTVEAIKIIGLRRKIAETLQRTMQRIPHFAYVEEIDVTELESLRVHLNAVHGQERGKLTLLPFLIRALAKVRGRFPQINATYDDEANIVYRHSALHVGIATQTAQGLVVPVARHAQNLDLWSAAAEIRRLADAARSGKARREELSGSTITITSLGATGGIVTTPVINAPEVAIIGVNKMIERPVIRNGAVVPRLMMNLSSSFDHRIVDGFDAAEFIQAIKALLEHPATLYLD